MILDTGLRYKIRALSDKKELQDKTPYNSISINNISKISRVFGVSCREVEIASLEAEIMPERYVRNMKSFSFSDQSTLLKSMVTIVGLGGLGGVVTEILARIGIGKLNLIDGDIFEESNLNRQYLCREKLISTLKADAAAKRVKEINSSVYVLNYSEYLDEKNAPAIIDNSDVVIDCLDSLSNRFILERASKKAGCRLVSAAVAGNYGHVTTIFPEDAGLRLIYGRAENGPDKGAETSLGALSHCVSLVASIEASEAIKILIGKESILRNKLLVIDLDGNTFETMQLL
ncbi:MAG: HesA/MoeB/ThiF family protein [Desulfobacterales bacterium]